MSLTLQIVLAFALFGVGMFLVIRDLAETHELSDLWMLIFSYVAMLGGVVWLSYFAFKYGS